MFCHQEGSSVTGRGSPRWGGRPFSRDWSGKASLRKAHLSKGQRDVGERPAAHEAEGRSSTKALWLDVLSRSEEQKAQVARTERADGIHVGPGGRGGLWLYSAGGGQLPLGPGRPGQGPHWGRSREAATEE